MSQYIEKIPEAQVEVHWGYDEPLQEYFLSLFDLSVMDDREEDCIYSIMSHSTTMCHPGYPGKFDWSNSEILELIEKNKYLRNIIPKEHKEAIALDVPF